MLAIFILYFIQHFRFASSYTFAYFFNVECFQICRFKNYLHIYSHIGRSVFLKQPEDLIYVYIGITLSDYKVPKRMGKYKMEYCTK